MLAYVFEGNNRFTLREMPAPEPRPDNAILAVAACAICGSDVRKATKMGPGSYYPILYRLEDANWLTSWWEDIDPSKEGRPRKRFYKLTAEGQQAAHEALAERDMQVGGVLSWR